MQKYKQTLLRYYEEEVMGEAYFYGLMEHFKEQEKLTALAMVERHAANLILPLLQKYDLMPSSESVLKEQGQAWVKRHKNFDWRELMTYMVKRYPGYLDDFAALENMAPQEDRNMLKILSDHEVAAIEFAERELADDSKSIRPLRNYLQQ